MFLLNGQIISSKKIKIMKLKFEQLNINLDNLTTTTIKQPKIQETSTLKLLNCFSEEKRYDKYCNKKDFKEILPTLNRRIIIPFYIPTIALICAFIINNRNKKNLF